MISCLLEFFGFSPVSIFALVKLALFCLYVYWMGTDVDTEICCFLN